jgi:uncharacterized protein YegP (UPF0339 family)
MGLHRWEFVEDKNGEFRWRKTAGNGMIVGTSLTSFKTRQEAIDDAHLNGYSDEEL